MDGHFIMQIFFVCRKADVSAILGASEAYDQDVLGCTAREQMNEATPKCATDAFLLAGFTNSILGYV
jgi:hypothetical protein